MSVTPTRLTVLRLIALALLVADQIVPPLISQAGGLDVYAVGNLTDFGLEVFAGLFLILAAALIALAVFVVIGFLLTNPSIYWLPKSGPVYLSLTYAVMLLATVGLAVLFERRPVTKAIASAATASTARLSVALSGIGGLAARASTIGTPVAEVPAGGLPYPGAPSFGVSSWNTGAARASGPANGKARASLALAIGALAINLVGRSVLAASGVVSYVALAILVVAVVLGPVARERSGETMNGVPDRRWPG